MSNFKITVVVPVYNRANAILRCLDSLAKQTLSQDIFEVVVVDDCSTDKTVDTVRQYGKIKNLRLLVLEENSGGASRPRNKGIEIAQGEYLLFIDSDDTLTEDALRIALALAMQGDLDMVVIPILLGEGRGEYTSLFRDYPQGIGKADLQKDKRLGNLVFSNPGVVGRLYKTVPLQESGVRFSEKMSIYEDTLFSRFVYSIFSSFGIVPVKDGHYYAAPAEGPSNLSLLKRTIPRCVLYIAEALRMCDEIPDAVIDRSKKHRILNNALCRANIYDVVNTPEGYEALVPLLGSLLPLMAESKVRSKAKDLISKVIRFESLQKQVVCADEYFHSVEKDLALNYRKAWIWKGRKLVIDFDYQGYRLGVDISDEEGVRNVVLVLRRQIQQLPLDWSWLGPRSGNYVYLFCHDAKTNLDEMLVKIAGILQRVKMYLEQNSDVVFLEKTAM